MVTALGLHSPRLRAVRDLLTKRGRCEQRRFAFEGATLLREALDAGARVEAVYATQAAYDALPPELAAALPCDVYLIERRALERMSAVKTSSGIVATAPFALLDPERALARGADALWLAGLSDPGNAGTLVRSAEIFGVGSVLFDEDAVEPYNPKVVRAAMGAIFRARLAVVSAERLLSLASRLGYEVVVAERRGVPVRDFPFERPSIVVVGQERRGVAGRLEHWDASVAVPQTGWGESLNAAVAGSIVLYELAQRRRRLSSALSTRNKP